jgi:hypothetical protein
VNKALKRLEGIPRLDAQLARDHYDRRVDRALRR